MAQPEMAATEILLPEPSNKANGGGDGAVVEIEPAPPPDADAAETERGIAIPSQNESQGEEQPIEEVLEDERVAAARGVTEPARPT